MKAESLRMFHFGARHFAVRGLPGWRLAKPSQRDNPAHKGAFGRRKRGIDDYLDLRRGTPVDPLALRQVVARAILVMLWDFSSSGSERADWSAGHRALIF